MKSYLSRPEPRKNVSWLLFFVLLLSSWLSLSCGGKKQPVPAGRTQVATKIPDRLPARIADGTNKEVLAMTLGEIKTPLADGLFIRPKIELFSTTGRK